MGVGAAPGGARSRRTSRPRTTTVRLALTARLLACGLALAGCSMLSASDDERDARSAPPAEIPVPPPAPTAPPAPVSEPRSGPAATRIERVSIESTPPTTRVVLTLDGSAEPEVSLLVNQRLVIDVPGTTCETLPRVLEAPGDALVERVRTGQHAAPTVKSRVVVDLRERADFTVRSQDQRIVVLLAPPGSSAGAAASPPSANVILGAEPSGDGRAAAPATVPPPPAPEPAVEAPPPAPEPAPVELAAPVATPAAEPVATAEPLVEATPATVALPASSEEPVAVSPTPALEPHATAAPADAAPSPVALPEALASPAGATAPAEPLVEATAAPGRISIDFTEADVRTVIDLIAAAGGYRVIFTPEVAGTVSITLVDRPWPDALETVLRAKQLREVRHEDVMLVSPAPRNGAR